MLNLETVRAISRDALAGAAYCAAVNTRLSELLHSSVTFPEIRDYIDPDPKGAAERIANMRERNGC